MTRRARAEAAVLLDGNVLLALVSQGHVHHAAAQRWFVAEKPLFATCPITQGTLLRLAMRLEAVSVEAALDTLAQLTTHPRHVFWPDNLSYAEVQWHGVMGHRQVTDAYLAALARQHQGKLATFDRGLAALHTDVSIELPNV